MIEVSRDQTSSNTVAMGPPVNTSGMSNIIIQLVQPEVAKTVLLRLSKPKDSSNLGLSQIRLLGSTTFSEAALKGLSASVEQNSKRFESAADWLYVLDRAIQVSGSSTLSRRIIETAVEIPDVLDSCYAMLIAPVESNVDIVSSVLFQCGSLRYEVSKQVMDALLGPVQVGFSQGRLLIPARQ
jgi:baculoviral IAP repeat-containing protein 6 (apollon)